MKVLHYVNPLQGTDSIYTYSNGNTLPLVALPNGMTSWSPQTNEEGAGWFFHPSHRQLQGIRLTHQPSPWIRDYGHLAIMPQTGLVQLAAPARASSFRPEQMIVRPDYFSVQLARYQTRLELAPAMRSAMLRITFGSSGAKQDARLILSSFEGEAFMQIDTEKRRILGYTRAHFGELPDNFASYFIVDFDCELSAEQSGISYSEPEESGGRINAFVGFKLPDSGVVQARIGTSFINLEQAERNMNDEIGSRSFDQVRAEASKVWEERLGAIRIEDAGEAGDEEKLRTFYTCLYRVCLFPRVWHELEAAGAKIHYSPFDGCVHDGPMYSDFGFWDLYRTSLPLYSLLYPSQLAEMAEAWVNVYKESGWMPKWISPGERSAMPGTLIDAALADVYVKGIRNFDVEAAYEGLKKHATVSSCDERFGRKGLEAYEKMGYLPHDLFQESVSNALDYHYGDFCIAQIAKGLGNMDDYRVFMKKAGRYRELFDKQAGFMRGRNEDGSWQEPFDPLEWGNPFCEGGAWQCSWAVPHDVGGLAELLGGREAFAGKLNELMTMKPLFKTGTYGIEIHEMSEMAAVDFGQFAISNQPSFHIPYLYAAIGKPEGTQYWARQAAEQLFSDRMDGLPGDEDNGSLGAWYVWNALGMYPLCPGTTEYVLGSPLFRRVTVRMESGNVLMIEAKDNESGKPYWNCLTVNGKNWSKLFLTHEQLTAGAELRFQMTDQPAKRLYTNEELPYSMSREKQL